MIEEQKERIENYFRVAGLWLKNACKDHSVWAVICKSADRGLSPQETFNQLAKTLYNEVHYYRNKVTNPKYERPA